MSFTALFVIDIVLLAFTSASVDLTFVSQEICIGSYALFQCNVTGDELIWTYNGSSVAGYTASINNSQILGPYNTELVSSNNGVLLSFANTTTNPVTSSLNDTTIECRDSSSVTPTTVSKSLTLDVKKSVPAIITAQFVSPNAIMLTWSGDTCIQSYRFSVYATVFDVSVFTDMVSGTQDIYTPDQRSFSGDYIFELTSIDYTGNDAGSTNATFPWKRPNYSVAVDINNRIANFAFENNADDERPPITDCSITFDDVSKLCVMDNNIVFNITSGVEHTYSINISNVVGTVNRNGSKMIYFIMHSSIWLSNWLLSHLYQ
ncbi:PREDICTED: uncharacterized protein LOC109583809 [Amphimedon queenslandica]|uniref:Ig-like domain-containing protein n=1 Tax=Amphimedon queenslandica TaxID=400682 RepID=A0AAN0JCV8_AMPQE|nr:PREDICTED: uncharacterized protein LOC109583809 [Amphimedon queenslandica]|eukprot:XP_019854845.1 PREDICTED: uncharacterized protein LOC109583809 [Amphimedon queenslandica]